MIFRHRRSRNYWRESWSASSRSSLRRSSRRSYKCSDEPSERKNERKNLRSISGNQESSRLSQHDSSHTKEIAVAVSALQLSRLIVVGRHMRRHKQCINTKSLLSAGIDIKKKTGFLLQLNFSLKTDLVPWFPCLSQVYKPSCKYRPSSRFPYFWKLISI